MRQKAERKAKDETADAAFARYLTEERKKDIEKQRKDNNARHAKSKLELLLYFNICMILNYRTYIHNYPYLAILVSIYISFKYVENSENAKN